MFCSSVITRLFVPVAQTDFEPRKMQTDAIYEPLSSRSSDKSIASDHRLDRSSAVLPNRSRKFEAHKSNAVPLLQSASAVNSDKMMCESIPANGSIGLPSNCNVAAHSPGRPADAVCSSNCTKLTTMDLTSRIKLSDKCSCVRARHATANCFANCSASNQSSFKLCAKRSSAIHADPTHRDHTDRSVNCLNSSKDKCMDKSPASRPAKRCTPATNRSAHRSSNESSIKSSKSSSKRSLNSPIDAPSHHSSSSQLSSLIRILTSFSRSSLSFTRTHQSLLVPLLLVLCTVIRMSDACSARSTPKPRPPLPEIRPNITFQTYQCPEAYAKWYCLNGATCFFVRIGESILYNCECADGYMGQRCEFKDLEGSYLQSREKVLVETAKVAGGTFTVLVLLAFVALIFFANYKKRKSSSPISEHQPPSINFIA